MTATKWTAVYYERSNGRCPTESFLSGLPTQDRVLVNRAIARLEAFGHTLGMPYIKKSGKVADSEIERALEYRDDYLARISGR